MYYETKEICEKVIDYFKDDGYEVYDGRGLVENYYPDLIAIKDKEIIAIKISNSDLLLLSSRLYDAFKTLDLANKVYIVIPNSHTKYCENEFIFNCIMCKALNVGVLRICMESKKIENIFKPENKKSLLHEIVFRNIARINEIYKTRKV